MKIPINVCTRLVTFYTQWVTCVRVYSNLHHYETEDQDESMTFVTLKVSDKLWYKKRKIKRKKTTKTTNSTGG